MISDNKLIVRATFKPNKKPRKTGKSSWVGLSPKALNYIDESGLMPEKEIVPVIRKRKVVSWAKK